MFDVTTAGNCAMIYHGRCHGKSQFHAMLKAELERRAKETGIAVIDIDRVKPQVVIDEFRADNLESLLRSLETNQDGQLGPNFDSAPKFWLNESHNIPPIRWKKFEALMLKKNVLSDAMDVGIRSEHLKTSRTVDFAGDVSVNVNVATNDRKAPTVITYDIFTGDVWLCTIQCPEGTITAHTQRHAAFEMHMAMRSEFHAMSADQLKSHIDKDNPYALHEQSVRDNDGDLVKSVLPPRYEAIRFVMNGAAE